MSHFKEIYSRHADSYDRMVDCEDFQGNLPRALNAIRSLVGLDVVEFGAGTGRVTRLLSPFARTISAFDVSPSMLVVAARRLRLLGIDNAQLAVADNRALPVACASADLAIEGWSFGHATGWYPHTWREEIGQMLSEMRRVLRPGGTLILIETLGTGNRIPEPPSEALAEFYTWLETDHHCSSAWIRTDYRFESVEEATSLVGFFFGEALADRVAAERLVELPECTGLWWRTV